MTCKEAQSRLTPPIKEVWLFFFFEEKTGIVKPKMNTKSKNTLLRKRKPS